jgi:bacillithiol synthase
MPINKSEIPHDETDCFSSQIIDYIHQKEDLKYFTKHFFSEESLWEITKNRSFDAQDRHDLKEVIFEQYGFNKENHDANFINTIVKENILQLTHQQSYTITTGHQLCVFTGPLYFIYKIFSVINLAEEMNKKHASKKFIPVYWMATEDHDFEEIASINIFGKKLTWENNEEDFSGPVGEKNTIEMIKILDELKILMGESESANKLYDLFYKSYINHENLADATRFLVHQLFGKYGLVIVDGSDKRLKSKFTKIIKDDILNQNAFKIVNKTIQELDEKSVISKNKILVNPREINVFYLGENSKFRERIVQDSNNLDRYKVLNTNIEFSKAELLQDIDLNPENYSPNVVLRPLYQETILPNIAYVGGPGELSYWMEYKNLFEHYQINYPVLVFRNTAMWIDAKSVQKLEKYQISDSEIFNEIDVLLRDYINKNSNHYTELDEEKNEFEQIFEKIKSKASSIDNTLENTVNAELQRVLNGLENLEKKLIKAEKNNHDVAVNQLKKIKEKLFPNNIPQERFDNFIPYYLQYGDLFFDTLKENLNPFNEKFIIFKETNA